MENLPIHIEYLLRHHECVVVPGIGAFMSDWQSACYDEMSRLFMPPRRVVSFNAAICHDDGMLASSVARRLGVDFQQARMIVERSVASIERILDRGEEVTFGYIGRLRRESSEGRIIFIPRKDLRSEQSLSGRMPIDMRRHEEQERSSVPQPAMTEKNPQNSVETRRFSDKNYYIAINKRFAHTAAAVVVAVSVMLAVFLPTYRGVHPPVEASVVPVEKIVKTISQKASSPSGAKSQEISKAAQILSQAQAELYYLVVATFHSLSDAENYIGGAADGKNMQVVKSGKTWRVAIAASADRSEVMGQLNDPSMQSTYPGLWIWKGKAEKN